MQQERLPPPSPTLRSSEHSLQDRLCQRQLIQILAVHDHIVLIRQFLYQLDVVCRSVDHPHAQRFNFGHVLGIPYKRGESTFVTQLLEPNEDGSPDVAGCADQEY